jgi:hypothetical protein
MRGAGSDSMQDAAIYIAISSSSLSLTTPSTSLTNLSVSFWISSSARLFSSSVIFLYLRSSLM